MLRFWVLYVVCFALIIYFLSVWFFFFKTNISFEKWNGFVSYKFHNTELCWNVAFPAHCSQCVKPHNNATAVTLKISHKPLTLNAAGFLILCSWLHFLQHNKTLKMYIREVLLNAAFKPYMFYSLFCLAAIDLHKGTSVFHSFNVRQFCREPEILIVLVLY